MAKKRFPLDGTPNLKKSLDILAAARREGTNGPGVGHFCHGCRTMVPEIYHVTFDRKRLCPACCNDLGIGPKQHDEKIGNWKSAIGNSNGVPT